jgi:preprotein translocase subunit SecG
VLDPYTILTTDTQLGTMSPMVFLQGILPYVQMVLSGLLIVAVILQRTGSSLGGAFGADNFSSGFHTRRGLERTLFHATIALGILFALSALINLLIS